MPLPAAKQPGALLTYRVAEQDIRCRAPPLDVAVVMDPIESIKIAKDSTFAMLLEAQRRGHRLHYVLPGSLSCATAGAGALAPRRCATTQAQAGSSSARRPGRTLGRGDVVLMRKDPPVDAKYLHDTQILGLAQRRGRAAWSTTRRGCATERKARALLFPQCCPPTLVSRDPAALKAFVAEHGDCVLKPLDGMGGRSIFRGAPATPTST
jgi:glutathione synthase